MSLVDSILGRSWQPSQIFACIPWKYTTPIIVNTVWYTTPTRPDPCRNNCANCQCFSYEYDNNFRTGIYGPDEVLSPYEHTSLFLLARLEDWQLHSLDLIRRWFCGCMFLFFFRKRQEDGMTTKSTIYEDGSYTQHLLGSQSAMQRWR